MRAILLAAGRGTRISKSIPSIPKCTLPVGDKPLVVHTIEMLLKNHIDVTIVVGYKHNYIINILEDYPIEIVYNPFFDVTNSIGSLWMAKNSITEDEMVICNADVFWSQEILEFVLERQKEVFLLADKTRIMDGDYFFYTEKDIIKKYGKELKVEERTCEYVGIAYISKSFSNIFKERLEVMVEQQQHGVWWENVLYSMTSERDIFAVDVEGRFWAEVDFIEDYQRIVDYVKSH